VHGFAYNETQPNKLSYTKFYRIIFHIFAHVWMTEMSVCCTGSSDGRAGVGWVPVPWR